jgi:iron complex transport system substrate-binding protein
VPLGGFGGRSLGAALLLAACRTSPSGEAASTPKVVSLHDVTTEIVVALDATDRLVGVADPVEVPPPVLQALAQVPRVEGAESILARSPTVILGTDFIQERSPELVAFLRKRGIDVWLATTTRLDDVFTTVEQVATRIGKSAEGRALVARLRQRVAALDPPPGPALPVFIYDCCDPPFTAARNTVITDVITRAGGRNVFADLDADWTKVSWEEAIARRPRLVIVHAYDYQGQGDVGGKRRQLSALPSLANLPTATLPLGLSLGGIRSVDALERLHPILGAAGGAR